MRPVVWISEPALRETGERLATGNLTGGKRGKSVSTMAAFLETARSSDTIAFVDHLALPQLSQTDPSMLPANVVAITRDSLPTAIHWLQPHPWLCHVVSDSMLEQPLAAEHLQNLCATMRDTTPRLLDWLGDDVEGRRIRLTQASKRAERLDRMGDYLDSKGVSSRTNQQLRDAAEELLTNAFYDAPVSAGAMTPISRTQDVTLPEGEACDLAYGCKKDLAIVRVRDPFGSLSRRRLVEVLTRCASAQATVQVDESMGGAGLGMWRIFSAASYVGVSVVKQRHTEILVGIAKRPAGQRPFSFHFFFTESGKRRFWQLLQSDHDNTPSLLNHSVLLEIKSK